MSGEDSGNRGDAKPAVHATAFIHATAVVDDGASIGADTKVWHFVHVCGRASIGERCVLGQNVFVAPGAVVGNGVKIQNNVSLYDGVVVEDDVFLGPSCVFTNVMHPRAHVERKQEFAPSIIRRGASIGANATVVCGNEVGAYAFVGAGAVVTKAVPPHALVAGCPARQLGWVCACGEKLDLLTKPAAANEGECEATCHRCASTYRLRDDTLTLVRAGA